VRAAPGSPLLVGIIRGMRDANADAPPAEGVSDRGSSVRPAPVPTSGVAGAASSRICRFLVDDAGAWRARRADREHRCSALSAVEPVTLSTQRRLCLTDGHDGCPRFIAAAERHRGALRDAGASPQAFSSRWIAPRRPAPPILLDPARSPLPVGVRGLPLGGARGVGPIAVLVVAAALLAFAGSTQWRGNGVGAASPTSTATSSASPSPSGSVRPSRSPSPSPRASRPPTATPSVSPSRAPSASPVPAARTYRVRSGDTLARIARRFGTTSRVLMRLNGIQDASLIRPGQVLRLP
jgi:LysM repeat protein